MGELSNEYRAKPQDTLGQLVLEYASTSRQDENSKALLTEVCEDLEPFAADKYAVKCLETRWSQEGLCLPDTIEQARRADSKSLATDLSIIDWIAHYADDDQLYDVLAWNALVADQQARDKTWYDALGSMLNDVRVAIRQAAVTFPAPAYKNFVRIASEQASGADCVIGEPLDLLLPTAYAYNQAGTKVFRRHLDIGVVAHELLHDMGGFMNPALSEGGAQFITRRILRFNNIDTRYQPYREGAVPMPSAAVLPETIYSSLHSGMRALDGMFAERYGSRHALIERSFSGDDPMQSHAYLRQAVEDLTGADLIGFCDRTYSQVLTQQVADGTHNNRVAAHNASNAVAHALMGANMLLRHSVVPRVPDAWHPVLQFLQQAGVVKLAYNH